MLRGICHGSIEILETLPQVTVVQRASAGVWRGKLYEKGWEDVTNIFGVHIYDFMALIEATMNVLHQHLCVLRLDVE